MVSVDFVPVSITDDDARQALADAEKMMSGPVRVTYEQEGWDFTPAQIATWIAFRPVAVETSVAPARPGPPRRGPPVKWRRPPQHRCPDPRA